VTEEIDPSPLARRVAEQLAAEELVAEELAAEELVAEELAAEELAAEELAEPTKNKHGWLVWLLIVLASLIAITSGLNVWIQRQILDTDEWVAATDELLADDEVRGALSVFLVDELYASVDVSAELEELLPEDFSGLAGPLSAALRGPATEGVDRLLNTSAAREVWNTANRVAHENIVAILKDDTDIVSTTGGVVTLELGELVSNLGTELGLPSGLIDSIPEDAGQIVLVESEELDTAQQVVRIIELASVLLFFLVVALYAGAVFAADRDNRRVAVRNVGWAIVLSGVVLLLLRRAGISLAVDNLADVASAEGSVNAAAEIGTIILRQLAWSGIAIGVLIAGYAILSGPTKAATATRRALAPLFANAVLAWVVSLFALYIFMAITPGFTLNRWGPALVCIALFVAGVEVFRRSVTREFPDASLGDQWDRVRGKTSSGWSSISSGRSKPIDTYDLDKLSQLHREGVLSDEEFAEAKRVLLSDL
jgi:hypothetical protein